MKNGVLKQVTAENILNSETLEVIFMSKLFQNTVFL